MNRLTILCLLPLLAALAACQRDAAPAAGSGPAPAAAPVTPATPVVAPALEDVIEHDPRYVIGISYPAAAAKYPGLATELRRYADAARADLMEAVAGIGDRKPAAPYDLALSFTTLVDTPRIVAVAADGSSYTGGAHGNPLVARFVWLPGQDKLLGASHLIVDAGAWQDVSAYVREQLHAALSQRIDADELPAGERAEVMRSAGRMIDEGSGAAPEAFDQFEPVLGADGRIVALRFVFPPYQVGPYADGTQTVDVPASVLLPHVAPAYRGLFAGS